MLPVDAHPAALRWSDDTVARNRIQTYDASFGLEATDPLSLHRESAAGMTTLGVARKPAGSVEVAGTGTTVRVVQTNRNGMMTIEVE